MDVPGRLAAAVETAPVTASALAGPIHLEDLLFEPVAWTRDRSLFALDAMVTGTGETPRQPFVLGDWAAGEEEGRSLLPRLFWRLRDFPGEPALILGVSTHAFAEDSGILTAIDLAAGQAGLATGRLILELAPEPGASHPSLDSVDELRALGFRVSLADSGLSEEGLRMLLELRPDYIRLGSSFVSGASSDFFRRAILDSFSQLAWKFGALLILGGADEPGDQATLQEAGVALMKGRLAGAVIPWEGVESPGGGDARPSVPTRKSSEQTFEDRSGRKHG